MKCPVRLLLSAAVVAGTWCLPATGWTAGLLNGSFTPVAAGSNVNLTAVGVLDWVHWGLASDTALNRKAGVAPVLPDFTLVGNSNAFLAAYQFSDNANGYSWSDGFQTGSATNTTTGVWAYGFPNLGAGFQLEVPADTSPRTLHLFVGTYGASGLLTASLSDHSAAAYTSTELSNRRNGPGGVYTLEFAADAPGQRLIIRWLLHMFQDPQQGNVTLQAAALTAPGANNPPLVTIASPANPAVLPAPASLSLAAFADDVDGSVAKVEYFHGLTKLGEATASPYSVPWDNVPAGHYVVTAKATDAAGASRVSAPIEVFVHSSGGALAGAMGLPPASVDLTLEGTADWAHWGAETNTSFNHKAAVARQIPAVTVTDGQPLRQVTDYVTSFYWSDGAPTLANPGTTTGVFVHGITNGFQLSLPADTVPRTARVYVGLYGGRGSFQAHLSDFSAPAFLDTSLDNPWASDYRVYTLNYAAAANGRELVLKFTAANLFDQDYGNITLEAVTLQGGPPVVPPVRLLAPARTGQAFRFSFLAASNRNYEVKFADSLSPPIDWQTLTNLTGGGAPADITDATGAPQRFYQVVVPP